MKRDWAETVEVPVTRTARVTFVGHVRELRPGMFTFSDFVPVKDFDRGSRFVVRPTKGIGYPFRPGIGTVRTIEGSWYTADTMEIAAFATGDYLYRVEDA